MTQPGSLVATLDGDSHHVARGALHPVGGDKNVGQVGKTWCVGGQVKAQPGVPGFDTEHAVQAETATALAQVAAPYRADAGPAAPGAAVPTAP